MINYPSNFEKSFNNWRVDDEYGQIVKRYILYGMPAGSFFTSVLAGDFFAMSVRSHPMNSWPALMKLGKWMLNAAPPECFGSYNKVAAWEAQTQDYRVEQCEKYKLVPTAWELLQEQH